MSVESERSKHRGYALIDYGCKTLGINFVNIAHKTVVHGLCLALVGNDNAAVGSGHSKGADASRVKSCHNVFVYQTAVNHGYDAQHVGVGNSATVYHLCFIA